MQVLPDYLAGQHCGPDQHGGSRLQDPVSSGEASNICLLNKTLPTTIKSAEEQVKLVAGCW